MPVRAGRLPPARGFSGPAPNSKTPQFFQIQGRALVRRQNFFPLQPVRLRFERGKVVRVFQRDVLKKFVVRRAGVRRAQFADLRLVGRASPRAVLLKTENLKLETVVPPRRPVLPPPGGAMRSPTTWPRAASPRRMDIPMTISRAAFPLSRRQARLCFCRRRREESLIDLRFEPRHLGSYRLNHRQVPHRPRCASANAAIRLQLPSPLCRPRIVRTTSPASPHNFSPRQWPEA